MKDEKHIIELNFKTPPLPSAEDKMFNTAKDRRNNACLNSVHDGWFTYARGYKDAADILVAHIEEKQRNQDTLVYPIVFLYRQYLELMLKNLIRNGRRLQDINEPFPQIHKIDALWQICSQMLHEISPDDSVEEIRQIGRLISEFCKVDPTSMAFRYPEDKKGNPSLLSMTHINLLNIRDVIGKIAMILNGADTQISEYRAIKADINCY